MDPASQDDCSLIQAPERKQRAGGRPNPESFQCLQERFKAALAAEYRRQLAGGAPPNQAAALALRALRLGPFTGAPPPRVH